MANQFLDPNWISMEVLRILQNTLEIAGMFSTDWDKDYRQKFAVGSTVQVKLPQRFLIRNGLGYNPQAINRISVPVTLDQIFGIDFEWDDYEAAIKLERSEEELREQYLKPAAVQLANEVDSRAANFATINVNNIFGVLGTDPTSTTPYLQARSRLKQLACPIGERAMNVSSTMMASYAANIQTLLNPPDEISRIFKSGAVGTANGWEWYESQNLYSLTAGTIASTITVSGANQQGAALIVTGTNGDTINAGDKFSIANVNQVNPVSRRIVGAKTAKPFTVLQNYTLTGGSDTIQISPAIFPPGSQYQNVDSFPVNAAAITMWPGTTSPNGVTGTVGLGLSKYAFMLVGAELEMPVNQQVATQQKDPQTGLSVRFVRAWDPVQSKMINRFDMAIGFGAAYPDNGAVAVLGA